MPGSTGHKLYFRSVASFLLSRLVRDIYLPGAIIWDQTFHFTACTHHHPNAGPIKTAIIKMVIRVADMRTTLQTLFQTWWRGYNAMQGWQPTKRGSQKDWSLWSRKTSALREQVTVIATLNDLPGLNAAWFTGVSIVSMINLLKW
jgi:hypothetical protein